MSPVISVEGLGIEFYRARRRRLSVREMVFHRRNSAPKETFWALRDISFDIRPGEAVGLVGGNGGGKSTLLKMIAGVLIPDEGSVTVRDGVAPLIELTGGFVGERGIGRVAGGRDVSLPRNCACTGVAAASRRQTPAARAAALIRSRV